MTNRDEIRWSITGVEGWQFYRFDNATENQVSAKQKHDIQECAYNRQDVIIADTNLNKKFRNKLIQLCEDLGFEIQIHEFHASLEELKDRDFGRGKFSVGNDVLERQWKMWEEYLREVGEL